MLGNACVCLHSAIPSRPPEKSQANPALCTSELCSRALSTLDTLLHTNINIREIKGREKKILSLPKRHSWQGRWWAFHFSPLSTFSLSFGQCSKAIEENSWVFRSSFKSFNHWLPQPGFNKHRCVLSIFVCSTTLGNRPTQGFKRQGEKTDTLPNTLPFFVSFKVVLKVSSLILTATKDKTLSVTCSTAPPIPSPSPPPQSLAGLPRAGFHSLFFCLPALKFSTQSPGLLLHQLHFKCILIGWNVERIHLAVVYMWSTPRAAERGPRSGRLLHQKLQFEYHWLLQKYSELNSIGKQE